MVIPGQACGLPSVQRVTIMTDVDQAASNGQIEVKPHQQFIQYLAMRAETESQTRGFDVAASQIDKILTSSEETFWDSDAGGTLNGQDVVGVELSVNSISFAPSSDEYDAPLGVYVLVNAQRLSDGAELLVNTGAALVITKLYAAEQRGMIPGLQCKFEGTKAAKGTVLKLRPIPARAVPARDYSAD